MENIPLSIEEDSVQPRQLHRTLEHWSSELYTPFTEQRRRTSSSSESKVMLSFGVNRGTPSAAPLNVVIIVLSLDLEAREPQVFLPPFAWESGLKTVTVGNTFNISYIYISTSCMLKEYEVILKVQQASGQRYRRKWQRLYGRNYFQI